jgi:hypothetical protein
LFADILLIRATNYLLPVSFALVRKIRIVLETGKNLLPVPLTPLRIMLQIYSMELIHETNLFCGNLVTLSLLILTLGNDWIFCVYVLAELANMYIVCRVNNRALCNHRFPVYNSLSPLLPS